MKSTDGQEAAKRRAGERAAEEVEDGVAVGLGTGSTAAFATRAIGRAVDAGLDVRGVATSFQSRTLAREVGVPLAGLDEVDRLDLTIDGADQVAAGDLLKGGGAAHAREKVVASASDRVLVVVDESKLADRLDMPVPVEVLPFASTHVAEAIRERGGEPALREASGKDGPVVTDNGNLVIDCGFGRIDDAAGLARELSLVPGVVEHGLFVGVADAVYVGTDDGVDVRELV